MYIEQDTQEKGKNNKITIKFRAAKRKKMYFVSIILVFLFLFHPFSELK